MFVQHQCLSEEFLLDLSLIKLKTCSNGLFTQVLNYKKDLVELKIRALRVCSTNSFPLTLPAV